MENGQFSLFRRKKRRRRKPNCGDGGVDDDVDLGADVMSAASASVSLYPEYCQRSNEEDAFLEIAQDFGDLIVPHAETGEQHKLPPPPPGFQVRSSANVVKKAL